MAGGHPKSGSSMDGQKIPDLSLNVCLSNNGRRHRELPVAPTSSRYLTRGVRKDLLTPVRHHKWSQQLLLGVDYDDQTKDNIFFKFACLSHMPPSPAVDTDGQTNRI